MPITEYTEPNVCIGENLTTDAAGQLRLQPWALVRPIVDIRALSGGDGSIIAPLIALPGKLLIDQKASWRNDSPLPQMVLIRVTRGPRSWLTSNPNAIQFRDRWTTAIDADAAMPVTTGIYNSQCGSAWDLGTNSVAEPNPGRQWRWADANSMDEWVGPIDPGATLNLWYRCYVWTPPPWSNNANKNQPQHEARANWTRIEMRAFPQQGNVVTG
ncbi:DUF7172 family protein [Mycobacteroides abscessus]|uniref:DUF7172 domain-containing protein n=1 Tax=Mycobacteroides abscessus TaxID=36809 RepID=A0A0U0ZMQ2_9MYCO|nr:hypothetical protein [Mycobacteroides abscessus]WJJ56010.1 hypothetical protein PROPHIT491_74 [Mycobacterium phage prophiT49-1]MBL3735278.1 hypothetical protein [Mycobacteroides abscessus subsp. massiliense]MBL3744994.1 hypothetical protein [Mycobacteroides abscessus subsp. massiliense]MBL3761308.1 hypothetical protein [Mycobacteroides abscessus subsp. massiliense]MBN7482450.1 hypothetical protein [Mycobacteroides abscessus subsp. massiliense]